MLSPFAPFLQAYDALESAALQRWLHAAKGRVEALLSPPNTTTASSEQQQPGSMVPLSAFAEGLLDEEACAAFPVARALAGRATVFSHGWVWVGVAGL